MSSPYSANRRGERSEVAQHWVDFIGGSRDGNGRYAYGALSDGMSWTEPNGERYIYVAEFGSFLFVAGDEVDELRAADQRAELHADLTRMANQRRRAEAESRNIVIGGGS